MNPETRKVWQRFRRNKPAFFALWLIAAEVLIAIFGYALAPDHTPDANRQIAEIALREPGFGCRFLAFRLHRSAEPAGVWQRLWSGVAPTDRWVAVGEAQTAADSVRFVRLGAAAVEEAAALKDLAAQPHGQYVFSRSFLLGTDKYGRDILSRLLLGFRVSLTVGLIAVFISLSIGVMMGALGGYFGGRIDDFVSLIINAVWSIPTLLLVFAIVLALGRGVGIIFLAVGLTMWVDVARLVRGQVLMLREMPFVEAAQSMGFGAARILWRHVLPNLIGPVLVLAAGNFATAILLESGLSYLGFGVQPPAPSWGTLLNENYGYAIGGKPWMAVAPALAIVLTVLAFNLVGNGLRDAADVRGK
ncbi:MAG TPA: ABC transporter permease [Saprospiraceae bacterium]|nr:ABC transporter permease [Saprospiraceae bacterium]HNM24242.1 ABC transporter permease [Saprospiraceae bacterium]